MTTATGLTTWKTCPSCGVHGFRRKGAKGYITDKDGNVHMVFSVLVETRCANCGEVYTTHLTE